MTATRREWIGLAVLALPTLLASLDMSVLFLALPHLAADLGAGGTQQLWILDVYGFLLAGFLVTMGTLGDRIGRRRLLMLGAAAFGAASLLAAYSTSPEMLIAARAALGVAGATLMPSTLALIRNMFHDPRQRGVAIATWMSCFMVGTAIGPLVGGVLLEWFWWGSVFLLAVPVMVLLLATAPFLLPEHRAPRTVGGRLDLVSVGLSLLAILPVVYGIKELARAVSAPPVVAVVAGLGFGAVFVARQRRLAEPLLDLRLFADRTFRACMAIMFFGAIVMAGTFLFIPLFLQQVLGMSPLAAGLWMLPQAVAMIASTQVAPHLARRFAPSTVMAVALLVAAAGSVLIAFVSVSGGLPFVVAGFLLACVGVAPPTALGTELVVNSAPPARAGSAASVSETANELGIGIGLAVFGSIGAAVYGARVVVPDGAPGVAGDSITEALAVAGTLPEPAAEALVASARSAFTAGLNVTSVVGAVLFTTLAVVAATVLRRAGTAGEVASSTAAPAPAPVSR
ncbi:MFS transporter [Actinophytocola gossypii]|uniref:MFS transporter n=2 Tax=Actinophytocola gossypii TaxID=2812003 RepID=A0ABT2JJ31_9PSEU|nr:MFS transporter [Actinophytocola gossypii]MCT2587897.1 MFS transporter [Actinophytocola gossypii]